MFAAFVVLVTRVKRVPSPQRVSWVPVRRPLSAGRGWRAVPVRLFAAFGSLARRSARLVDRNAARTTSLPERNPPR